jgi:putative addiction module component (TIGR02574 family)
LPALGDAMQIQGMTKEAMLSEILKLPPEERLDFLGDVWDVIAQKPEDLPIPEWHVRELERRLAEPSPTSIPWEQVRAKLRGRDTT